jgi:hypothetical protein
MIFVFALIFVFGIVPFIQWWCDESHASKIRNLSPESKHDIELNKLGLL